MVNSDVELEEDTIKSLLDLVEEGQNRGNQLDTSIFMVPKVYRDQNPRCFDPRVVSIGPLHRGHENVKEHEGLKGAYMHDLLACLDSPPNQTLKSCLLKVNSSINKIKLCYGGMNGYHDSDVAKMMVTDACFILEFIRKVSIKENMLFWGNKFTSNGIFTDLLLMENQIPFFVLQDIFDLTLKKIQKKSLITLLLDHVLRENKIFQADLKIDNNGYSFKHILEILYKSCEPDDLPKHGSIEVISHSVVEFDRAGVKFRPNRGGNMEMAMEDKSFGWLKATFTMPVLSIEDWTELVLRNLIAYEQSYPDVDRHYFTSFAFTMDMLVDSTEDVAKLVESKVIFNYLGSNEHAANMISNICSEVGEIAFIYQQQLKQLEDYYKRFWPKNMAWLRRTYFNSPWSVIALVAGILLFALTAIQTIFTVMSA